MNTYTLHLQSSTQYERFDEVISFVGEDASGCFGILANHERMMSSLVFGLARFRLANSDWFYIAAPGTLLYFRNNELFLNSRHFLIGTDFEIISEQLEQQLLAEEQELSKIRTSLHRMEQEMLKRLWQIGRGRELL